MVIFKHILTHRGGIGMAQGWRSFVFGDFRVNNHDFHVTHFISLTFTLFSVVVWSYELIFKLVTNEIKILCVSKKICPKNYGRKNPVEKTIFKK